MEESSNTKMELAIVNGPLAGQTFTFLPRSKIHIGRVVRGNNLTIKDPSISSKHLSIIFDCDIGGWMLSDLDSSNGTFLNGRALDPLQPTELSDGDVIKIGESTSILVKWMAQAQAQALVVEKEVEKLENVGRKACVKGGRGKKNAQKLEEKPAEDLEVIDELRKKDGKGVGPRVELEKISGVCENLALEPIEGPKMVTRGKRKKEHVQEKISLVLEPNEGPKMVTRGRRKKEILQEKISGVCENLVLEQNEGSKMVTRGRGKKGNLQVALVGLNERQEMSTKEAKVLETQGENAGQQADLKKGRGRRGKQKVEAETLTEVVQVEKQDVGLLNSGSKLDETKEVRADKMPVHEVIDICPGGAIVDQLVDTETLTEIAQLEKEDSILLNSRSKLDETEDARDDDNMQLNEVIGISQGGAIADQSFKAETLTGIQLEKEDSILLNLGSKLDETEDARDDVNVQLNEVTGICEGGEIADQLVEAETSIEIAQLEKEDSILLNSGSKLDETEDAREDDNMQLNEVIGIADPSVEAETLSGNVQVEKEDVILLNTGSKLDETEDARDDDNMPLNEVTVDPLAEEERVNGSVVEGSSSFPSPKDHNDFGRLDLESMTLSDLFDHWEVSLPKQIIDATELLISDMRQTSKKIHEFRLQCKNAKD